MSLNVEVKIDVILHATESQEKIFDSFKENFGLKEENFKIKNLTGHFDNPITIISTNLKKKDAVSFISNILKTISKTEFNEIYDSIDENITSSGLKLKINKSLKTYIVSFGYLNLTEKIVKLSPTKQDDIIFDTVLKPIWDKLPFGK